MESTEQQIRELRRSIWMALSIRTAVYSCSIGLWVCGCGVMAARLLWLAPLSTTAWAFALLPVIGVLSVIYAARRVPADWMLRAELDRVNHANGLLMAEGEVPLDRWESVVTEHAKNHPKASWNFRSSIVMLSSAMLFAMLTLLLPSDWLRHVQEPNGPRLNIAEKVDRLEARLETLEELAIVPKEQADSLQKELESVEENAEGDNPAKTLESLKHAETQLAMLAEQGASEAAEKARQTSQLADAADALDQAQKEMSPSALEESMKELAKMMQEAAEESKSLEEAAQLCEDGLSADELAQLSDALGDCFKENSDLLKKLAENGMIDPKMLKDAAKRLTPEQIQQIAEQLKKCENGCPGDAGDLEKMLEEAGIAIGEGEEGECIAVILCAGMPGRGGISRGPGAARLDFSGETDEQGAIFKSEMITPGGLDKTAGSVRTAVTLGQPGSTEERAASVAGGLTGQAGSGGSHARRILPQHRTVVQDYFKRNRESMKESP